MQFQSENNRNYTVSFLIPFFSTKMPPYFKIFLNSCRYNLNYEFVIFTNILIEDNLPENIRVIKLSEHDLGQLISLKLNIDIEITSTRKICDFKPAFGAIFNNYFHSKFWGHLDIDVVLGDLKKFIGNSSKDMTYDIRSFRKEWLSGPCAIYRNTKKINYLFKKSKDWKKVFTSKKHYFFDECGIPINKKINIYQLLENGFKISDISTEIESFTHVLLNNKDKKIKIIFKTDMREFLLKNEIVEFKKGTLSIFSTSPQIIRSQKYLLYHFIREKNRKYFQYPVNGSCMPDTFYISIFGFHNDINHIFLDKIIRILKGFFVFRNYVKTIKKIINFFWGKDSIYQ